MNFTSQIESLINAHDHKLSRMKPSEWVEKNRVMSSAETAFPGKFSLDRTPYLREPLDHLSLDSDARIIAIMKGVQIGFSSGVLEPGVGFIISQQPGNIMLLARDESLVKRMMETRIDPMLHGCGIHHLIKPNHIRARNQRTGDTSTGKEFAGGTLMAGSVQTPSKMRQVSIQYGFIDDYEAAPRSDKDAGDSTTLIETRFASYYKKMKLYYISTPEVKQTSNIEPVYELGDKRRYLIPCPCCGEFIPLEWEISFENSKDKAGIAWKLDKMGRVKKGTVGYVCQSCSGFFTDQTKFQFNLDGFWKATQEPSEPGYYSYHISSLYAPPGMYDWEHYARQWVKIHPNGGTEDTAKKKAFFNTVLGLTWEEETDVPEAKYLQKNQRKYKIGSIPSKLSVDDGNGNIALITCACDLGGKIDDARIDYEIVAWSVSGASYSIIHGSIGTFIPNESHKKVKADRKKWTYRDGVSNSVWNGLRKLIEADYLKDEGKDKMKISVTGIDTGYFTEYAYSFLNSTPVSVIGLKGDKTETFQSVHANNKKFKVSEARSDVYLLDVNAIKDDLAGFMKLEWMESDQDMQPCGFMNFPESSAGLYGWNNFYSHFEAEQKVFETDKDGNFVRSRWKKKKESAQNHLFDCRIYNIALREIIVHRICKEYKVVHPDWRKYCQLLGLVK